MANPLKFLTQTVPDAIGLTNYKGQRDAMNAANAALEGAKSTAEGLNADTQALMNPNMQQQIQMATDAAMANFGGAGNLYSSGAQKGVADRAQAIAASNWQDAANRAMAMQQGNANITAGQGANRIAQANQGGLLGQIAPVLSSVFG